MLHPATKQSNLALKAPSSSPDVTRDFDIEGVLGQGGMGVVFLGWQRSLERRVAIKCIRCDELGDDESLRRFKREALVLAGLEHPGIVKIFSIGEVDGQLFIVSEFVAGETLLQRLRRHPYRWRSAVQLIIDVAQVIQYVHRKAIVHRDIKSENVLLPTDGGIKVIDFGLAKDVTGSSASHNVTQQGEFLGTPEYLAPEVIRHQAIGPRCDIYALGVLLFEVVTGRPPFQGPPVQVLTAHLKAPLPSICDSVPQAPPFLDQVFWRAMAKKPEDRQPDAGTFAFELERVLEQSSAVAVRRTLRARAGDTVSSARKTVTASSSDAGDGLRKTGVEPERRLSRVGTMLILASLAVASTLDWSSRSSGPASPGTVRLMPMGRGIVHVSWDGGAEVDGIEVRMKTDGGDETWKPFASSSAEVTIAGLLPGNVHEMRFRSSRHQDYRTRSFEAPFSALRLVDAVGPAAPGGESTLTFIGEGGRSIVAEVVQGGRHRRMELTPVPDGRHRFDYVFDEGVFTECAFYGRTASREDVAVGVPVKDLAHCFIRSADEIRVTNIVQSLVEDVDPPLRVKSSARERRRLITAWFLQSPPLARLLSLAAFLPQILQDPALPWELRRAVYRKALTLVPFDQFGLKSGAGLVARIEAAVAPICRSTVARGDEGHTVSVFDEGELILKPREGAVKRGDTILTGRVQFVGTGYAPQDDTKAEFEIPPERFRRATHAVLIITNKKFSAQYSARIRCNEDFDLLWTEDFSDGTQLNQLVGNGRSVFDWGSETMHRRWILPLEAFRPGRNLLHVTAEAPFGLDSVIMPSIVRLAWDLGEEGV